MFNKTPNNQHKADIMEKWTKWDIDGLSSGVNSAADGE